MSRTLWSITAAASPGPDPAAEDPIGACGRGPSNVDVWMCQTWQTTRATKLPGRGRSWWITRLSAASLHLCCGHTVPDPNRDQSRLSSPSSARPDADFVGALWPQPKPYQPAQQ